ncbi:hypothetical protein Tco_1522287 [Tanacetum coccineum]
MPAAPAEERFMLEIYQNATSATYIIMDRCPLKSAKMQRIVTEKAVELCISVQEPQLMTHRSLRGDENPQQNPNVVMSALIDRIVENLHFVEEPIEIVDRDVKKLKRRRIPLVKVHWNSRQGAKYTWEREDQFRKKYPNLFSEPVPSSVLKQEWKNLVRFQDLQASKQEHEEHLKLILELLKKEELYAKFSMSEFWIPKVQFLSHVVDSKGIHVDSAKIESMKDWASPKTARRLVNF